MIIDKWVNSQGSDGQVLTSTGSGVAWEDAAGGGITSFQLEDGDGTEVAVSDGKEVFKASKRFGESFNKEQFLSTNQRVKDYLSKANNILKRMGKSLEKDDLSDIKALIEDLNITCPESGSRNWTDVKQFNLMFGTKLGASADTALDLFLRPETAQGIFVNFLNVHTCFLHFYRFQKFGPEIL